MDLVNKIVKLCELNNITLIFLETKLGFGIKTIYKWNKNSPSIDRVMKVADYFNVSTDFLLNRKPPNQPSIPPEDLALLEKIKNLSPERRKAIEILSGIDEEAATGK